MVRRDMSYKTQRKTLVNRREITALMTTPAQQPRARPEVSIVNKRRNRCNCHVSCQFACDARTCDDRFAAAPAQRLDDEVEGAEELGPGSAFGREQPLSPRRAACPGSGEGVVIASWLRQNIKTRPQEK